MFFEKGIVKFKIYYKFATRPRALQRIAKGLQHTE